MLGFEQPTIDRPERTLSSWERPLFLLAISMVLTASFIMSVFTPFALAMMVLLHGRVKGLSMILIGTLAMLLITAKLLHEPMLFWAYLTSAIFAVVSSEIILQKIPPLKGVMIGGAGMLALVGSLICVLSFTTPKGLQGELASKIEEVAKKVGQKELKVMGVQGGEKKELVDLLSKPQELAKEILRGLPFTLFVSIFFGLWVTVGLLVRSSYLYLKSVDYPYSLSEFLNFKTPEYMIWPLIAVMAIMLLGPYWSPEYASVIGKNLLFCFGLFYFFQGFGILVELLTQLKIEGTFRSLLIILTIVTSYWILALVGLFDMWIDFRRLMMKKFDRGDIK